MFNQLEPFLPNNTILLVQELLQGENYHLIVTKPRKTKHGDFTPHKKNGIHQITVNGNLNEYAFLITLIHEIAHLKIWNTHKNKVQPHGQEWKNLYGQLLVNFTDKDIFPAELELAIKAHINNPKYASCADPTLTLALRKYDDKPDQTLLNELPLGTEFILGNRHFKLDKKLRTRYICTDLNNGKKYRVHGLAEVKRKSATQLS